MTSLDKDGFTVKACGKQAQSQRTSAPDHKWRNVAQGAREAREKMFLSEAFIRPTMLGRCSPESDRIELPSTLNPLPRAKFGTAERPKDFPGTRRDPEGDIPTNDALQAIPDSQPFKYRRQADIKIGTDPRGKLKDAELMKAHGQAFYGRTSPGPAGVGEAFGPNFLPTKPRMAPARSFGKPSIPGKAQIPDPWKVCGSPEAVYPGLYPRESSLGQQHLTQRRNQSVHAFPKGPQIGKTKGADTVSVLDAARSCIGKQPLHKNKSEPAINFNCDSRKTRDRSKICYTEADLGPVAQMPKQVFRMPPMMASERGILGGGIG